MMIGCEHVWGSMATGSGTTVVASDMVIFCMICGIVTDRRENDSRFKLTIDPDTGARYLQCRERTIARTIAVSDTVKVDLDGAGGVVGVELL